MVQQRGAILAMKQTTRALRALSPKRSHRNPRPATSGDDDSDTGPASSSGAARGSPHSFISLTGRISSRSRQRPRRRRSSAAAAAAELPELEKSEEDFKREWGISREREEILLVEFRKQLEAAVGGLLKPIFDRFYLRRFLRARQHDLAKAKAMFLAHLKWREENSIDDILTNFQFQERDAFLSLYPQGYHKTDKLGRPVYIQHIGAIKIKQLQEITTEDRMVRFHIQEYERCLKYIFPSCGKKAGRHIDQTFAIMDVKGVGLKHLTGDVKSILSRITETDQNNYPETLGKTVIINAPTVFKMIWAMVRPMLDVRTQAKIEVAPSDYMKLLLRYIDVENIPEYLGGKSKGSLIDDVGPWKDPVILAQVEADIARRDRAASSVQEEVDGGMLSGDSLDLEAASSNTPLAPPSPLAPRQHELEGQQQAPGPAAAAVGTGATLRSTAAKSPFDVHASVSESQQQQHPSGHTDSELEEFQDAQSRRLSILSTSGSSAYMSAGEDDSDFFTPKHSDLPPVGTSGLSFRSDRPLLTAGSSSGTSPEGKLQPPVAGVEACPPHTKQQQGSGQQGAGGGMRYSDQYLPDSPERHNRDGAATRQDAIQAGRQQQQHLPAVVIAAANNNTGDGGDGQERSGVGGPDLTLNGDIAMQTQPTTYTTPSSGEQWGPSKGGPHAAALPSPHLQIPILARVRALEEKLPEAERHIRRYLSPGSELPSKTVGQGTLLHRVEALERAMDAVLCAQHAALDQQRQQPNSTELAGSGCSGCCCIM